MKKTIILLLLSLSFIFVSEAQTQKIISKRNGFLAGLKDVSIDTLNGGDMLMYNFSLGKWIATSGNGNGNGNTNSTTINSTYDFPADVSLTSADSNLFVMNVGGKAVVADTCCRSMGQPSKFAIKIDQLYTIPTQDIYYLIINTNPTVGDYLLIEGYNANQTFNFTTTQNNGTDVIVGASLNETLNNLANTINNTIYSELEVIHRQNSDTVWFFATGYSTYENTVNQIAFNGSMVVYGFHYQYGQNTIENCMYYDIFNYTNNNYNTSIYYQSFIKNSHLPNAKVDISGNYYFVNSTAELAVDIAYLIDSLYSYHITATASNDTIYITSVGNENGYLNISNSCGYGVILNSFQQQYGSAGSPPHVGYPILGVLQSVDGGIAKIYNTKYHKAITADAISFNTSMSVSLNERYLLPFDGGKLRGLNYFQNNFPSIFDDDNFFKTIANGIYISNTEASQGETIMVKETLPFFN
ncbi:MAG: hypothetical protein H6553_06630 [Chitinophagales bacterium]|nr:hypothetical protein [Chitinophagales bacterium]